MQLANFTLKVGLVWLRWATAGHEVGAMQLDYNSTPTRDLVHVYSLVA